MHPRALALVVVGALVALTVVTGGTSGAIWTAASQTPVAATAVDDWTPPLVSVTPLPSAVSGSVAVTATATDERSAIASTVVEFAPAGTGTWTALACTGGSGTSPATASCTWSTVGRPAGGYDFRARATDVAGYSATSALVSTEILADTGVVLHALPGAVRGTVTVTGTILNPPNGSKSLWLEYLNGTTWTQLNGSCTASGSSVTTLSCSWSTALVADGGTQVRARAMGTAYTDVRSVVVDNGLPTTTLQAPAGVLSAGATLSATASDAASGIASVAFAYRLLTDVTWTPCGADTFAPYTCTLDTTSLTDGAYSLRAIATDAAGNESLPSTLTRTVDNSPADVSITAPAGGATVSATTTVTVAASSGRGVASVRVEARALPSGDFVEVCTDTLPPYSCAWNVSALNGGYALRAVLTETYGGAAVTSAQVTVTVDNAVGSLTVTSPAAGATVSGTVTVSAGATPAPGRLVTSVRFESGPTGGPFAEICTDVLAPYSCQWSTSGTVYSADHRVRAVMTQSDLTTVTSTTAVVVDNVTGTVDLVSPAPSARLTGTVPVTVSLASNAAATGVEVVATSPGVSDVVLPCTTAGTPPATLTYSCPWNTNAVTRATYSLQARATLANGVGVTDGAVAGLDVRNLRGVDVQAVPTKKFGELNGGDAIVLTWSDLVDLTTLPTSGTATIVNDPAGDRVQLPGNLGTVRFGTSLVTANLTVSVSVLTTSVTRDGVLVTQATVTFGNLTGNAPTGFDTTPTQLVWTPLSGARSASLSTDDSATDPVTESGSLDADV